MTTFLVREIIYTRLNGMRQWQSISYILSFLKMLFNYFRVPSHRERERENLILTAAVDMQGLEEKL